MSQYELTKLIGMLSLMSEGARTRSQRKRYARLVSDLCAISDALYRLEKNAA